MSLQAEDKIGAYAPSDNVYLNTSRDLIMTNTGIAGVKWRVSPSGSWNYYAGGQSATVLSNHGNGTSVQTLGFGPPPVEKPFSVAEKTMSFDFETYAGVSLGSRTFTVPAWSGKVYRVPTGPGASTTKRYPSVTISFNAEAATVTDNDGPPVVERKELEICLMNNTDQTVLTRWGSKALALAPGLNHFRYDGEVDGDGMPLVRPGDFQGTLLTVGGNSYLVANLEANGYGGLKFGPPPVVPPVAPSAGRPQLTGTNEMGVGVVLNLNGSNGVTTTSVLGPPVAQTPSNTTGTGATISDPSKPKPVAGSGNTVTNVTNNNFDNTVVKNTTNVVQEVSNDALKASDVLANMNEANALQGDGILPVTQEGNPLVPLKAALGDAQTAASGKFGGFINNVLAVQTIPKTMVYSFQVDLGEMGSISQDIDFSKNPFPPVRAAMVVVMTLGFCVAFMSKITI